MTAEELARRLITLIFAGRNRRDMIRWELPRTKRAGLGRSRIVRKLDLLEMALVHYAVFKAGDNELTRCRESWAHSDSC